MQHLTLAYMTNRPDPKIRWFFDSLHRETGGDYTGIKVVVVDYFMQGTGVESLGAAMRHNEFYHLRHNGCDVWHVASKPTVWQGPHRLTSTDYFAASNARNTAICHAPDGWIAFVDDLSVLMPGWLNAVREAMVGGYIVLGAYKKVKRLEVTDGEITHFENFPDGVDSRWNIGRDDRPVVVGGSLLYGCSLAAPVDAFLKINGFDEDLDSIGMEDCAAGIMLERAGYSFRYDRRMLTYESEEDHAQLPVFKRLDKGVSPNDSSHAYLKLLANGRNRAPNYFGDEGLAGLRKRILAGEPFPVRQIPANHWFDGQPLAEM